MSRLYDTLRRIDREKRQPGTVAPEPDKPIELLKNIIAAPIKVADGPSASISAGKSSRLVALTDPQSLGAEKFRALVARLENLRQKGELKSLQITSAAINEGKSLVAANLAVTLVKHFGYKVLLAEGDLHRPSLTTLLGLSNLDGINQWWRGREVNTELSRCIYKLDDMQLWFLSAGPPAISHRKFYNRRDLPKRLRDWLAVLTGSSSIQPPCCPSSTRICGPDS